MRSDFIGSGLHRHTADFVAPPLPPPCPPPPSNCVSGLCCACSGENKDRAECRNGTNVESFVHLGEDFPLRKLVEGELKDANIDEICALGKLILPLYQEEFTPCAGASVAYTVPPEKSTPIPGSCRDMDHKHRKHCNQILTGCGFTPMQLEAQAEGATWDTDARMLQCLDTLACGCNFTTQGVCASKTLAAAFPPFQNPAFGDGMEHYNLNNASQYLRSQLEALGREPLPPCIDTGSTVAPTKYPACVEDDPIQCNFFLETCGEPAGYYIDRVIESKWTDPEFMVRHGGCVCVGGRSVGEGDEGRRSRQAKIGGGAGEQRWAAALASNERRATVAKEPCYWAIHPYLPTTRWPPPNATTFAHHLLLTLLAALRLEALLRVR